MALRILMMSRSSCLIGGRGIKLVESPLSKKSAVIRMVMMSTSANHKEVKYHRQEIVQHQKPVLLIAGAGWAGYRMAMDINKVDYDVYLVSPRNHFLFTPLLPSTAVGTLEFRAIQEPVRTIPGIHYYQATINEIDFSAKSVICTDAFKEGHSFSLNYDALVLAPGSETNTFGVPGIANNPRVRFLKQLDHSRSIRNNLIECFERASSPGCSEAEQNALLTFVVVGGGPTSVEFAAELCDFVEADVSKWYPDLRGHIKIVIVEASGHLLGAFHDSIVTYVESLFTKRNITVLTKTAVTSVVDENKAVLSNGDVIPFGVMIWSAGIKQVSLVENIRADVAKGAQGRILIDPTLRVLGVSENDEEKISEPHNSATNNNGAASDANNNKNHQHQVLSDGSVFALGDCACDVERPLPMVAQVASQQAIYLANAINKHGLSAVCQGKAGPFNYTHLGAMASVGTWKGVYDSTNIGSAKTREVSGPPIKGLLAFLLWRAAYWTKQVSLKNKMLILTYWFKSFVFGRDISRF